MVAGMAARVVGWWRVKNRVKFGGYNRHNGSE